MHSFFASVTAVLPVEFFGIAVILLAIIVWLAWKLVGEWRRSREPLFQAIEKSHPVLGTYTDRLSHWTAAVPAEEGVDGMLGISAQGRDPTELQLQTLEAIRGRLPGILTRLAPFVSAPRKDGAGHSLPAFRFAEGKLMHLAVDEDGSFHARVSPAECPEFKLKLIFEVDREEKLTCYTWNVPGGFPWGGKVDEDDDQEGPQWSLKGAEHGLGEEVELQGMGEEPTEEQLGKVREIAVRLPGLLKDLAPLVSASESDSRKGKQAFDLAVARVHEVRLLRDGAFSVTVQDSDESQGWQYWMTLELEIDRDWKMVDYQWAL